MEETIPEMLARVAAECESDATERPKWRHGRPRPLVMRPPFPTATEFSKALRRAQREPRV